MTSEQQSRLDLVERLVGRLSDLEHLPSGARPPVVVLRGSPGIGKSQVLRDVADRLEAAGRPVRRAAGGEAQRHLAFGALLHLLPPSSDPVTVEFELVQRLRAAMIAQATTAVLVIDDVALLDERSAGLVESVMLHGDVAVLAAERTTVTGVVPDHPLSTTLRSMAETLEVPPMTDDELSELLRSWLGPGEVGSIRWLNAMAQGNPLVLHAIVTAARTGDSISERDGLWYLRDHPRTDVSLERLVADHLDRLGEQEWELLRCLAVAGSLRRSLAVRIDNESLERLERDGLVRGDPCEIAHPLYAGVIADSLSPEEVRRVSSKLVAAAGPEDEVDPARYGSWMLCAEVAIDDQAARRGAMTALARWENDLARDLIESIEEPSSTDLVQLIWAHANAGRTAEAAEVAERAVAAAATDAERVDAVLAHAELWALQLNRRDDAFDALVGLRATIDDPSLLAKIDGATSLYSHVTGNRALAESAAHEAASAAEFDNPGVRLAVLIGAAFDRLFTGRYEAAAAAVAEGMALADRPGERHNWVRLRIAQALIGMFAGDLATARAVVSDSLRLADLSGIRPAYVVWLGLDAQLAQITGDFSLAESRTREAIRAGDHVDDFGAAGFVRGDLAALLAELGRDAELGTGSSPIGLARARIRLAPVDDVDSMAADLARRTADAGYEMWAPWIAREAVRRGPAPECAVLIEAWAERHDGPVVAALASHAVGVVEGDGARVHAAATDLQKFGYVVPALDAHAAACRLLLEVDGPTAALRQRVLSVRSLARTVTPSLPPALAGRLDAVFHAADLPSERQLEIAELASTGLASKEIAERLIVSARTVDNHLAAVYRKLDVNSRDELAAVLRRDDGEGAPVASESADRRD